VVVVVVVCSLAAVVLCNLVVVVVVVCSLDAVVVVVVGRNMTVYGSLADDGTRNDESQPRDDGALLHSNNNNVRDEAEAEEDNAVGHVDMYLLERAVVVLHCHS
jgi:hypothetical protein